MLYLRRPRFILSTWTYNIDMEKELKIKYKQFDSFDELNADQQKAILASKEAQACAYAPYSQFKVGAALLLTDDTIIKGSNQENKAYPAGLCAERVALFAYGAQPNKSGIKMIAISGGGELLKPDENFTPCGGCRQVMAEFTEMQDEPFEIILENGDKSYTVFEEIQQLLPFIFGEPKER